MSSRSRAFWVYLAGGFVIALLGLSVLALGLDRGEKVTSVIGTGAAVVGLALNLAAVRQARPRQETTADPGQITNFEVGTLNLYNQPAGSSRVHVLFGLAVTLLAIELLAAVVLIQAASSAHPRSSDTPAAISSTSFSSESPTSSVATMLSDLRAINNDASIWTTRPVKVKRVQYFKAFTASGAWCTSAQLDFSLDAQYARFKATVGMADETPSTGPLDFYILVDDKLVRRVTKVGVGEPQVVEVSIAGASRLTIGIAPPEGSQYRCPGPDRVGVWADPSLTK